VTDLALLCHMSELSAPLLSLNPDLSDIVLVVEPNWYWLTQICVLVQLFQHIY
jgi:hypothetical protein